MGRGGGGGVEGGEEEETVKYLRMWVGFKGAEEICGPQMEEITGGWRKPCDEKLLNLYFSPK
jgi:hypothetical protein